MILLKMFRVIFVLKVNKSFINYRNFINDDSVEINYMYTWDLVCNIVFEDKKNLIIFRSFRR